MNKYEASFKALVEKLKQTDLKDIPEAPQDEDTTEIEGRPRQIPKRLRKQPQKAFKSTLI